MDSKGSESFDCPTPERSRPVVGLTTYLEPATQGVWNVRAALLPQQYVDGVTESGGVAVLLPPQPNPRLAARLVLDGVDGLVLTGGADVQPELYGADRHEQTDPARPERDEWEIALFDEAEERRMPVLAICRGLQVVNVARGGTLLQHLPEDLGTQRYRLGGGVFAVNEVTIAAGSRVAGLLGAGPREIHSYHHQAIDRLGDGLMVTARSDDGLVQAVESTANGTVLGVQWHPEEGSERKQLFSGLVAEASAYAGARGAAPRGSSVHT